MASIPAAGAINEPRRPGALCSEPQAKLSCATESEVPLTAQPEDEGQHDIENHARD